MPKSGRRDGCRQQQRANTLVLQAIVDGDGQFLDPIAKRLEHEVTNNPSIDDSHEAVTAPVIHCRVALGLLMVDPTRRPMEAQDTAIG